MLESHDVQLLAARSHARHELSQARQLPVSLLPPLSYLPCVGAR